MIATLKVKVTPLVGNKEKSKLQNLCNNYTDICSTSDSEKNLLERQMALLGSVTIAKCHF